MPQPTNAPRITTPRLILASASPQRRQLMGDYGYDVEVIEPPLSEPHRFRGFVTPAQRAEVLSYFKAKSVATLVEAGWIISGDTVVALRGRIFGKPADRAEAEAILSAIAGTTHDVITGVTLLDAATGRRLLDHAVTKVTMRALSGGEMQSYLDSGAWRDKAGAYGIQDRGDAFIDHLDGSFTNVVGFPMELVAEMLGKWGLKSGEKQR